MATVVTQAPGAIVVDSGPAPPPNRCCHYATAVLSFLTGGGMFILGIVVIAALPNDKGTSWAKVKTHTVIIHIQIGHNQNTVVFKLFKNLILKCVL